MNATRSLLLGTASLGVSLFGADLALVGPAQAATITEPLLSTGTHITEYPTNGFGTLDLQLFNSTLGTLTSATVVMSGTLNAAGTGHNTTNATQTLGYDKKSVIGITTNALLPALQFALSHSEALKIATNTKHYTIGASAHFSIGPLTATSSTTFHATSGEFSQFEHSGGGSAPLTISSNTVDQLTETGGAFSVSVGTTLNVDVAVVYGYTPVSNQNSVPEPGSLVLLGTGLSGLGAIARRKRLRMPRWLRWRRRSGGTS